MKYVILSLVIILLSSQLSIPKAYGEEITSSSYWADRDILVDTELTVNVVFIGLSVDGNLLEESLRDIMPWYAPYIIKENRFAGLNFSEINLNVYKAPANMEKAFADYLKSIDRDFFDPSEGQRITRDYEEKLFQILGGRVQVYWADAWLVANWLNENGPEYIPAISPNEYTIYFIASYDLVKGVVEYYVDVRSPETNQYFLEGGMTAFGGLHRLYFIDLTAIPLARDRCGGAPNCKSATLDYYPSLLLGDLTYRDVATYIAETIIYIFFRGYLYQPKYEINFYNYFLIIDATSTNAAPVILSNFSTEHVRKALNRLYIYSYMITESRIVDVDEYPQLRQALFSTLRRLGDQVIVDCETVPDIVFNLPIIKRLENLKTVITVLFVFDEEAYVCESGVTGTGLPQGALSAISNFILRVRGPSTTLYHEAAHVLGLRHPHDADPYPLATGLASWLYDWSATPMTYCSACRLRTMAEGEYFAQMDFDSIDLGVTLDMMRRSRETVYNALRILEANDVSPPPSLESVLEDVDQELRNAAGEISRFNYFNWDEFYGIGVQRISAFDYAFSALQKALTMSRSVETFLETLIEGESLKADLDAAMADLQSLRSINSRLEDELKSLTQALESARKEKAELEGKLSTLTDEFKRLENSLKSLEEEKQTLMGENQALNLKLAQTEREAASLRNTVTILTVLTVVLAIAVAGTAVLSMRRGSRPPPPPPPPQMGPT
jgi:HPt (histidine-containing phosphotransfer) domain-containing protein